MKQKVRVGLFIMLAVLQLSVPLYMIYHWENVLRMGRQYCWRTVPVDPYDALRGRYVQLSFKEMQGAADGRLEYGQQAYALIEADDNGEAYIIRVSAEKPVNGEYLKVKVTYVSGGIAHVTLPFNRFYMREDLAGLAQSAYSSGKRKDGYAVVRIKDGLGVIENLYIGDKKITDYLRENK